MNRIYSNEAPEDYTVTDMTDKEIQDEEDQAIEEKLAQDAKIKHDVERAILNNKLLGFLEVGSDDAQFFEVRLSMIVEGDDVDDMTKCIRYDELKKAVIKLMREVSE